MRACRHAPQPSNRLNESPHPKVGKSNTRASTHLHHERLNESPHPTVEKCGFTTDLVVFDEAPQ